MIHTQFARVVHCPVKNEINAIATKGGGNRTTKRLQTCDRAQDRPVQKQLTASQMVRQLSPGQWSNAVP